MCLLCRAVASYSPLYRGDDAWPNRPLYHPSSVPPFLSLFALACCTPLAVCNIRVNVVACLTCGMTGCGRKAPGKHALAHHSATGHPLTIDLNSRSVFCYLCNDWVLGDNSAFGIQVCICECAWLPLGQCVRCLGA